MLAINLLLLRHALGPLRELTSFARRIDPLEPGLRLQVTGGDSEATELADAFNDMLERLEAERRASVGRALAAQEGERLRVAQELHDGVGQSAHGRGAAARARRARRRRRRQAGRDRSAGDRPREPRGGAADRAPAAPGGARRPRPGQRAARPGRARGRAHRAHGRRVRPARPDVQRRRGARALPRGPGGADERRAPRGRQARGGPARAAQRPSAAGGRRRRRRAPATTRATAAACSGCASARCSSAAR